jgi:hypothetical protein
LDELTKDWLAHRCHAAHLFEKSLSSDSKEKLKVNLVVVLGFTKLIATLYFGSVLGSERQQKPSILLTTEALWNLRNFRQK